MQLIKRKNKVFKGTLNNFNNQLLVVSVNRLDDALKKLAQVSRLLEIEETPLSGIIITGDGEIQEEHVGYFNEFKIPVLRSLMDTYEVVKKISQIEVKINTRTHKKEKKAIELFKEHVNLESLLERID